MKRSLIALLIALGSAVTEAGAFAQTTSVTAPAGSITMGGTSISTGTVVFVPVLPNGTPVAVTKSGGGLSLPGSLQKPVGFLCSITAGGVSGCDIPDQSTASPSGFNWNITFSDTSTGNPSSGLSFTLYQVSGITGASYRLDEYTPAISITSAQANTVSSGTGAPPSTCVQPSLYIQTGASPDVYVCSGSIYIEASGMRGDAEVVSSAVQAAITAAGNTGNVVIPSGYTGTDSYSNPSGIKVADERPLAGDDTRLNLFGMVALLAESGYGDDLQARTCAAAGSCTLTIVGDSTSSSYVASAPHDSWATQFAQRLKERLYQSNAHVTLNTVNLSIAGADWGSYLSTTGVCQASPTTGNFYFPAVGNNYNYWPSGCTPGDTWQQQIDATNPDIVLFNLDQNDCAYEANVYSSIAQAIAHLNSLTKKPTIILTATFPNGLYQTVVPGCQAKLLEIGQVTADLAKRFGVMLIDGGRALTMLRDGYDPRHPYQNFEQSFNGYPSGWTTVQGTAGTVSGSTLTVPSGGGLYKRQRNADDFDLPMTVAGLNSSSQVYFAYRLPSTDTTALTGYYWEATYASGTNWSLNLYWNGTSVLSGPVTCAGSATGFTIDFRIIGSYHAAYCNGSNTPLADIGTGGEQGWEDGNNPGGNGAAGGGYFAIGILGSGGTITENFPFNGISVTGNEPGGMYLSSQPTFPNTIFPVSEQSLFGSYFNSADEAQGDFLINPYSNGGDNIHHLSARAHDDVMMVAALPVLLELGSDMMAAASPTPSYATIVGYTSRYIANLSYIGAAGGTMFLDSTGPDGTTPGGFTLRCIPAGNPSGALSCLQVSNAGALTVREGITETSTVLITNAGSFSDGHASATGTLTNAPTAGNPTKWIPVSDNGTTRYIPAW